MLSFNSLCLLPQWRGLGVSRSKRRRFQFSLFATLVVPARGKNNRHDVFQFSLFATFGGFPSMFHFSLFATALFPAFLCVVASIVPTFYGSPPYIAGQSYVSFLFVCFRVVFASALALSLLFTPRPLHCRRSHVDFPAIGRVMGNPSET
jgi:hypothetical protein